MPRLYRDFKKLMTDVVTKEQYEIYMTTKINEIDEDSKCLKFAMESQFQNDVDLIKLRSDIMKSIHKTTIYYPEEN